LEIPATDMKRCQAFYGTVFGWEFAAPKGMPAEAYAMFSKPGTKLGGGISLAKEGELIQPQTDSEGRGQVTNKITMVVEEVEAALKSIEAAGGKIVRYAFRVHSFVLNVFKAHTFIGERQRSEVVWDSRVSFVIPRGT